MSNELAQLSSAMCFHTRPEGFYLAARLRANYISIARSEPNLGTRLLLYKILSRKPAAPILKYRTNFIYEKLLCLCPGTEATENLGFPIVDYDCECNSRA